MAITYDLFSQKVLRLLNDPGAASFTESIVYDGVVAAHDAILPWVPKMMNTVVTSGSDGQSIALPNDLYLIQAVKPVDSGEFLRKATMAPGTVQRADLRQSEIDWIEYPRGYITLGSDVGAGESYVVYYLAYWTPPASESDITYVLEVPRHALQGMLYYAASICLSPPSINSATIRQFNLRIDSGTPEDNPLKVEADYMLRRFYQEMKLMPAFTKVSSSV